MKKISFLLIFIINFSALQAQKQSIEVKNDKLIYLQDEKGNRVLDFSFCGYQNSATEIPVYPGVVELQAVAGDNATRIQRAIDYVSGLKPDKNGIRGAILLQPGDYHLEKSLRIYTSGVVLRGKDKNTTRLIKTGYDRGAIIYLEGKSDLQFKDTFETNFSYLPVNQTQIELKSVAGLTVGEQIKIERKSTKEWIASLGCDEYGGGISALGWKAGDLDIQWDRTITAINGNVITIQAPMSYALDAKWGKINVYSYHHAGRIQACGIENLSLESAYNTNNAKDEDHCWTGIYAENAIDCWVRQINFKHLAGSAVALNAGTTQITVEDCISKDPISEIGGHRRNTFQTEGQLNLFQRCVSYQGIHDFSAGYAAPGPNAFVQCEAIESQGFSGSTSSWSCGLLFDIVNIDGNDLIFKNMGQDKNGTGWNTANSLFWQCSAAEIACYSPDNEAMNRAYGCWAQFSGNGEWVESNNHIQPRSFFYAQLADRLSKDVSVQARILPMNTNASSSPTIEVAQQLTKEARIPLLTLESWINEANPITFPAQTDILRWENLVKWEKKVLPTKKNDVKTGIQIINGKITSDGKIITGAKLESSWWSGKTKPSFTQSDRCKPHITRFVPDREGHGLTDRTSAVVQYMAENDIAVFDHNYGLWYDRRRDDHERIRRRDGDVWAPFYEQPFARSGRGTAWDGLSKYDLTQPNQWYWMRLNEFAEKAAQSNKLLYHEMFFQHNIIEAGAHWVDCPWRTANNINETAFPEPVKFAGDKRIFYAEMFYDTTNIARKKLYRNYIRMSLNQLANQPNVVHLISAEYTGPLHFVQFWLDVIGEWENETCKHPMIALSTTKDVQDAILNDSKRSKLIDIIDIRYWHKKEDGSLYAPAGGQNLAPRQHARLTKVGKASFESAYSAILEYRTKYPEKAVSYYAQNYPDMAWAVLMAGGSVPQLKIQNDILRKDLAGMQIIPAENNTYKAIGNADTGYVIFSQSVGKISFKPVKGQYHLYTIDLQTGASQMVKSGIKADKKGISIACDKPVAAFWLQKK